MHVLNELQFGYRKQFSTEDQKTHVQFQLYKHSLIRVIINATIENKDQTECRLLTNCCSSIKINPREYMKPFFLIKERLQISMKIGFSTDVQFFFSNPNFEFCCLPS